MMFDKKADSILIVIEVSGFVVSLFLMVCHIYYKVDNVNFTG